MHRHDPVLLLLQFRKNHDLRPFKVTPTTLKPACQEHTYDPHSSTYDPSRSHLRPSNRMSGSHDDPFRTLAEYKGITQSAWKEEGLNNPQSRLFREAFLALYGVHIAKARRM